MEPRHWGPFTGRQLTTIICVITVLAFFPVGAWAVTGTNSFLTDPVTGARARLDSGGAQRTYIFPAGAFAIPPLQASVVSAGWSKARPDPSNTRYAITSFTVSNTSASQSTLRITSIASSATLANCGFIFNSVATADGPEITVGPNSTEQVTFPTPFITGRVAGQSVCLAVGGNGFIGLKWSLTAFKLIP